uniref:Small ribosomal subunit protein uS11c n=1 Tax=Amphilophium dusenianum TaxID=2358313 RepID=A0A4P9CXH9_9LAMI|nr:ribosomal protein S11 [Amphilophium dusenianum]YP_009661428.1 ribosomal protein S11 [Amphilophium dusenianum]QCT82642.1 ribosomal protein S11 [Amphilophium dusenianum]QCT82643.1 ribosomal protein S11 [Amphilophium dusenianum]
MPRTGSRRNVRIGSRRNVRIGSRRHVRIGSRRHGRISLRKIVGRIPKGVIHVQASFHNIIVTVTDLRGRVVSWSSAGTCGFKGTRKGTPFAARTATEDAIGPVIDHGMQRAGVMIKGPGLGRDAALRAIRQSGIRCFFIRDVTPMAHNGCRPPKRRRI